MKTKELEKPMIPMNLQLFASGEGEGDNPDVTTEDENQTPEFDLEAFKLFAETNPDAKAFIQQSTQAKIDKGVQTMFDNKKEELIAEAKLEASNLTPEQKEVARLRQEFESMKADKALSDNRALVLQELNDIELDSTVKPYVQQMALDLVDVDPKKTSQMLSNLSNVIDKISESTTRNSTYESVSRLGQVREDAQPSQQAEQPKRDMIDPTSYGKAEIAKAFFGK